MQSHTPNTRNKVRDCFRDHTVYGGSSFYSTWQKAPRSAAAKTIVLCPVLFPRDMPRKPVNRKPLANGHCRGEKSATGVSPNSC
jgi:hypothetical protein